MNYIMNQKVFVIDEADGKRRPCKVVNVDNKTKKVKIHYINWKATHDEILSFDSPRIHLEEDHHEQSDDNEESFLDSQDDISVGSAIGKLMRSVDGDSRKIISKYDVRQTTEAKFKQFSAFNVKELNSCAEDLRIQTKSQDGKKLFNKGSLVLEIISKIETLFPQKCTECKSSYVVELKDTPYHNCYLCKKPSHDCEAFKNWHGSMSVALPSGFVWLCASCHKSPADQMSATSKQVSVDTNSENDAEPPTEDVSASQSPVQIDNTGTRQQREDKQKKPTQTKKPVCKFHLYRKCRHGRDGLNCNFEHPKMCLKFIKKGNKPGGCSKGKKCSYHHPPLCRGTNGNPMICTKAECKFYHLQGTRFDDSGPNPPNSITCQVPKKSIGSSTQQIRRTVPNTAIKSYSQIAAKANTEVTADETNNNPEWQPTSMNQDFLDLKMQMTSMAEQIQWLISTMRNNHAIPTRMTGWSPPMHC